MPSSNDPGDRSASDAYRVLTSVRGVLGTLFLLGIIGAVITAPVAGTSAFGDSGPAQTNQVSTESATAVEASASGSASHDDPENPVDRTDEDIRSMEYGNIVSGEIDTDDPNTEAYRGYHEPITFDGSEGDTVSLQMIGGQINSGYGYGGPDTDTDPYLLLVSPDGDVIARNDDSQYGLNSQVQGVVLPSDGEYTIVATSFGENQTFDYSLRLENDSEEAADLRSIERNSTATGAIDKNDPQSDERRGFYEPVTFNGSAGEQVEIDMWSQPGDTYLQLLDPDGNLIAENDDSERLNSSLDTSLPSDGEYTIIATSFSDADTFEYELSLSASASGDGGVDLRQIQDGQSRESELDEDDPRAGFMRGYFEPVTFDGESGQSVTIDMSSASGDTYLFLYGPDGTIVAQNDDYDGLNSRIQTTLDSDGEYTIIATSYDEDATFDYELSLSTGAGNGSDLNADLRNITYGETREGAIDSDDPESDTYRGNYEPVTFDGEAGDDISIDMTSEDDTYLILLAPNGTIVAENDDYQGLDSHIEASLDSDGEYTIIATSFSSRVTFPYELTLERTDE